MREIKFRCWDTGRKQPMIYFGSKFSLDDDADTISFLSEKDTFVMGDYDEDGKRFILMQYTGLKDKNGKEIYEGDIIRQQTVTREGSEVDRVIAVRWEDGGWRYKGFPRNTNTVTVIGNIYENPELIKQP